MTFGVRLNDVDLRVCRTRRHRVVPDVRRSDTPGSRRGTARTPDVLPSIDVDPPTLQPGHASIPLGVVFQSPFGWPVSSCPRVRRTLSLADAPPLVRSPRRRARAAAVVSRPAP